MRLRCGVWIAVLLCAVAVCAAPVPSAHAQEVIKSFDSHITVAEDGDLIVTETIVVRAEGAKIKRGIFRDLIRRWRRPDRSYERVPYEVLSVKRDGKREPHHIEKTSGTFRVYIGRKTKFLDPGTYTYELSYKTGRQLRHSEEGTELYWNVTGNGWEFPIETASARFVAPSGGVLSDLRVFTGRMGSTASDATADLTDDGTAAVFETTQPLGEREGMTIAARFDTALVTVQTKWSAVSIGFALLCGMLAFCGYGWWRVGRDPKAGVVIPRWDLPDDMPPAMVAYIDKGSTNSTTRAMSAALINLAVKGRITLSGFDDDLTVHHAEAPSSGALPVGETALLRKLPKRGVVFNKSTRKTVASMAQTFRLDLYNAHGSQYFKSNWVWILGGLVLMALALGIFAVVSRLYGGDIRSNIAFALGFCFAALFAFVLVFVIAGLIVKSLFGEAATKWLWVGVLALVVGLPLAFLPWITAHMDWFDPWFFFPAFGIVAGLVWLCGVIGAPTVVGRKHMDKIAGLRLYLEMAEKDRMNLRDGPDMSPKHYENLLPYAVALGIEEPWSRAFEGWLSVPGSGGETRSYRSSWNTDWARSGFSTSTSLQSGMASSLASAMPSSSGGGGGGGGSSGGGGGGGGGGGW